MATAETFVIGFLLKTIVPPLIKLSTEEKSVRPIALGAIANLPTKS